MAVVSKAYPEGIHSTSLEFEGFFYFTSLVMRVFRNEGILVMRVFFTLLRHPNNQQRISVPLKTKLRACMDWSAAVQGRKWSLCIMHSAEVIILKWKHLTSYVSMQGNLVRHVCTGRRSDGGFLKGTLSEAEANHDVG